MRNLSYENEFYSQVHSNANHTHFHMKDFALGLGLKQRQKATRKWPIVFPRSNELNFGMWPSTSLKNIPPYLSLLVSLSFSTSNVCKNVVFFLAVSFPKKAFVFPNNRISEARICPQCWLKQISRKRKTKQQKK